MILALDTATRWTALGLHDGSAVVMEMGWQCFQRQTVELAPAVDDMMRKVGVEPTDLKAVAVALGPGSYTGLRVGLGFAKGYALAYNLPLLGVPTLDIIAAAFGQGTGQLAVVVEAGRGRIACARYLWHDRWGWRASAGPTLQTWEQFLADLSGPVTFAGEISAAARQLIRAASPTFQVVGAAAGVRRAGYLAELGWRRLRSRQPADPVSLTPIYLGNPAGRNDGHEG